MAFNAAMGSASSPAFAAALRKVPSTRSKPRRTAAIDSSFLVPKSWNGCR